MKSDDLFRHIAVNESMVGKYVFLPGKPERVPRIAAFFDNAEKTAQSREHTTWTGFLDGVKVSACSTGMGGPSSAICMEEFVKCKAHTFIRIGGCGATQSYVKRGDLCVPNGAVRMEGTGLFYLPVEFPALPDYSLLRDLEEAAEKSGLTYHIGVTVSKDSFYGEVEPERSPRANEIIEKWHQYESGGAICTAMEEATLFIVASSLGVRCASILFADAGSRKFEPIFIDPVEMEERAIRVGIEAMRLAIRRDKMVNSDK